MNDLKSATQALLDLGRFGDDPTDAAVAQNQAALAKRLGVAALGAGAITGSTAKVAAFSAGASMTLKAAFLSGALLIAGGFTWQVIARSHGISGNGEHPVPAQIAAVVSVAPPVVLPAAAASLVLVTPADAPAPVMRAAPSARPSSARSIKGELELVRAAQQALNRGEPQAALALLAEHAQKFPSGALREDREALRVFALCRMGNAGAARTVADSFIRRAPQSPFADRVRGACRAPALASSR